MSVMQGQANIR